MHRTNAKESPVINSSRIAWHTSCWVPCALAALLNVVVLSGVALNNREYLADPQLQGNADARHYVILGDNIVLRWKFSRCSKPPYVPDVLRTPVFPVVVGILHQCGGLTAIFVFHALMHVASTAILYHLVDCVFGRTAAFFSSLLLACDVMLAISNFEVMSEPTYLFLNLAALSLVIPPLIRPERGSFWRSCGGGILLSLATLTRPVGLYLPVVYLFLVTVSFFFHNQRWKLGLQAIVTVTFALLPVCLWIVRNWLTFSLARLTTNDAIMFVYFFGAGAYQVEHELTLEQAQARISTEYGLPHPSVTNNHWMTNQTVAEMDAQLRAATLPVISKYPVSLIKSSLIGVVKATVSHNAGLYANITAREWHPPGMAAMLQGDLSAALKRMFSNSSDVLAVFAAQIAHTLLIWPLAVWGVISSWRNRERRGEALIITAVLMYFLLTLAIVGHEAYARYRLPHMPFVCVFAGLGATACFTGMKKCWLSKPKRTEASRRRPDENCGY